MLSMQAVLEEARIVFNKLLPFVTAQHTSAPDISTSGLDAYRMLKCGVLPLKGYMSN